MFKKAGVLFLYAETPLHAGSGASVGVVDLPIQRERHTQFPIVQASGVKGALRDLAHHILGLSEGDGDERIDVVFGPRETGRASEHGGALALTDARVLLFPVRSVKGVFTWITCPTVIERFKRDLGLLRIVDKNLDEQTLEILKELEGIHLDLKTPQASTPPESSVVLDNRQIILEDFCFEVIEDKRKQAEELARWLSKYALPGDLKLWRDKLRRDLVVLSDDDFREFTQFATEVITRIKLGETGTVEAGPWDEEHLPSETLLYSLALATRPKLSGKDLERKHGIPRSASDVLKFLRGEIVEKARVAQFGGDETIGRGLMRVYFLITGGGGDER